MRIPDPKANTTTEAYLAYKAGYLEESELKPVLYEPYLHFDAWLAYWAGLTDTYPNKGPSNKNIFDGVYENGLINGNTGEDMPNENAIRSKHFIKVSPNTIYRISVENYTGSYFIYEYKADMTYNLAINKTSDSGVFQTNAGTEFVRFRLAVGFTDKTAKTQIEKGATATEYEPYYAIPEMLTDEEALVAYLSGVTNTYPEEIKDPYDVRIVGYLKHLVSARWPEPDYPVNNEEFYLSTMKPPVVTNDTPSADIELDDTAEAPFIDVKAYGDTSQTTYTGKNLASIETSSETVVGGLAFAIENGTIKINGTTSQGSNAFFFNPFQTNDGVARFWVDVTGYTDEENTNAYIVLQISDDGSSWTTGVELNLKSTSQHIKSITLDSSKYYRIRFYVNNNTFTNSTIKLQLEYGTTATAFEPYVGGVPAPNPNYPQPVNVVTGRQVVKVSGKNIFSFDAGSFAYDGDITQTHTDNSAQIIATGTRGAQYVITAMGGFDSAKTYCISCKAKKIVSGTDGQPRLRLYIQYSDNGINWSAQEARNVDNPVQGEEYELSATFSGHPYYRFFFYNNSSTPVTVGEESEYWNIQLEEGSTATSFVPYISPVSYEINLGKNLFNGILEEGIINGNTGLDMPNSSYVRCKDYVPVEELTNYSISSTNADIGQFLVYEYKADYSYNLSANRVVQKGSYWQTKEGTKYIRFRPSIQSNDTSMKFQIELGTTATEYAPYFEPIELCKIGDYQDYIYQDADDDWYLHKVVNYYVLNSTNITGTVTVQGLVCGITKPSANDKINGRVGSFCSNATLKLASDTLFEGAYYENPLNFVLCGNGSDTLQTLHSKYEGGKLYYVLATPTDTQITNSELISQLNALKEGGSYEGKTYIKVTATDPNLPALLKIEAGKYD